MDLHDLPQSTRKSHESSRENIQLFSIRKFKNFQITFNSSCKVAPIILKLAGSSVTKAGSLLAA